MTPTEVNFQGYQNIETVINIFNIHSSDQLINILVDTDMSTVLMWALID